MKAVVNNQQILVRWNHEKTTEDGRKITCCQVLNKEEQKEEATLIGESCAVLGKNDNFCRNTGRKISLARALKTTGFSKSARRSVWKAYYQMRRGNW